MTPRDAAGPSAHAADTLQRRQLARYEVTRLLAVSSSLDAVIEPILQAVAMADHWVYGAWWSVDADADVLVCTGTWCRPGHSVEALCAVSRGVKLRRGEAMPGRAWESGVPISVENIADFVHPARHQAALEAGVRGGLLLPVMGQHGVLGILEFMALDPLGGDDELTAMLTLLSAQIGLFIERVAAHERRARTERRMALLADASATLLGKLEVSAVVPAVLRLARQLMEAKGYALWRAQPDGEWHIVEAEGLSDRYVKSSGGRGGPQDPGTPIAIEDVRARPEMAERLPLYEAEGIRAMLVLPLRIEGLLTGSLVFYYSSVRRFPDEDLDTASTLANIASAAMNNALSHESQAALRATAEEAQRRWRQIVDSVEAVVWEADPRSGALTFVGQRAELLLGHSAESWTRSRDARLQLIHPADRERYQATLEAVLHDGRKADVEYRMRAADGRLVWVRDMIRGLFSPSGKLSQVLGVIVDITRHKNVEAALQQRMDQLQSLYALSLEVARAPGIDETLSLTIRAVMETLSADRAAVMLLADDGRMRMRSAVNLSERYRRGIEGHSPWAPGTEAPKAQMVADVREEIALPWRTVFEQEGIHSVAFIPLLYEDRLVGKLTLAYDAPRQLSDEELHLAVVSATHLAFAVERRKAETALRESEARYHRTFDDAPVGIAHSRFDGALVRVNRRLCDILGYSGDELLAMRWTDLLQPGDVGSEAAAVPQLISGAIDRYTREKRFRRSDGSVLWALLSTSVMADGGPAARYFVTTVQDVSERKRFEEALRASEEQLREALEEGQMRLLDWPLRPVDRPPARSSQYAVWFGPAPEIMEGIAPEDRPYVIRSITEAVYGSGEYTAEFRLRAPGTRRASWSEVRGRIQRGQKGLPVRLSGLHMDITERKTAEFQRTARQQLTDTLSTATTLEEAGPAVLRALGENLDWAYGELWTVFDRGRTLRRSCWWADRPADFRALTDESARWSFQRGEGMVGGIWETGSSVWLQTASSSRYPRLLLAHALGLGSVFSFPVMLAGKVICVVTLWSRASRERDEAVVNTVTGLGSQLGQFLERRRAELELREETRIVEALQRIGGSLTAELELERVVQSVTDEITSLVGARAGVFYYRQQSALHCTRSGLIAQPDTERLVAALEKLLDGPRSRGGDALIVDDLGSDPRAAEAMEPAEVTGARSVLAVPVVARTGEHVGGWFFAHGESEMFGEREARIAVGIAAWSAVAVENSSLYDLTRRAEEDARTQLEFTRTITGSLGESVFAVDRAGRLTFANPAFEEQFGWTEEELIGEDVEARIGSPGLLARVLAAGRTVRVEDLFLRRRDQSVLAAACTVSPILARDEVQGACVAVGDVTEQRRATALMAAEKRMLGRIAEGAPLEEVLDDLVAVVEEQSGGLRVALLLASADRRQLEYAAAPSLPEEMRQALGRQVVAENLAPSAAAAESLQVVIVPDIAAAGAQWSAFRELALRHGLRATVSTPVVGSDGRLLGVLSGYYGSVHIPPEEDIELLSMAAHVARIAIDRQRADEERLDLLQREQRAREETEGARRRLANILGSITDAFVSVDREWRYSFVNDRYAHMLGVTGSAELLGRRLWEDFPHARETDFFFELQYALREQVTVNFEVQSLDLGRWLDVRAYPLQDGLAVYFQDISGRKALEDARDALYLQLEGERGRLEAVVQQMPAAVVISDSDGRVAMANRLVDEIVGEPGEEGYGASLRRLGDDSPYPDGESPMHRALRGEVVVGEEALYHHDDRRLVIRMSAAPLRDPFGKITGSVVAFYDISEQKRMEEGERFLARASAALGSSLDYESTLESLAWMAVPHMADWCAVDIVDEATGTTKRLAVAHVDPEKIAFVREVEERYPPDPNAPNGVPKVLQTGKTDFWPDIPDALLVGAARDAEHLRLIRLLGLRSAMIVPLKARGRTLGALSFVTAESGRLYDEKDVRLAEDLAQRAAFAYDNARLHRETALREQRARFLADLSRDLSGSLRRERSLDSVVRSLVENGSEWCAIELINDAGRVVDVVVAHRERSKEEILRQMRLRFGLRHTKTPASRCIDEKRTIVTPRVTPELVRETTEGPEHLAMVETVGAGSAISAPLLVRGEVLGALTVVSAVPDRFGENDREFVDEIANRIALSLDNARLYRAEQAARAELDVLYARERDIVKTLGRSFLGAPPAHHPHLDLAAEHRFALEANRVGGDYYDFVPLDENRIAVVVGDVCGKGIQASVFTATTKYMLRAYAFEEPSPARVLARLNQSLYREMSDNGMFVTLVYAVLDSRTRTVTWANAGHPPPVLFHPDESACRRLDATGGLLGGIIDARFEERSMSFEAGCVLAVFTDGVSEASGELDPTGDGGVCEILQESGRTLDARGISARILQHAVASAGDQPRDDLAIVVVKNLD